MPGKTLIFIPTYNESENAPRMCAEIHKLGLDADVLFVDDNSPDGTGKSLEAFKAKFPRLIVHHRSGKLGIGSAHFEAIEWAYDQGYEVMVTLDCDFTHSPSDIPKMIDALRGGDVAVGSRWLNRNSLPGWNLFRRSMTILGHLLTRFILGVPQDASGAFRAYRLDRLPRAVFRLVKSRGYSFFFESLFILNKNNFQVREVPIVLPARTYGSSKMDAGAALRSARLIFELALANARRPERFLLEPAAPSFDERIVDPQDWDSYWNEKADAAGSVYGLIAGIYRRAFIKPCLERAILGAFSPGSELLHAGCGSGQVDTTLQRSVRITALDISPGALRLYARNNPGAVLMKHGSIFQLPFGNASFAGVYNLGVMEHFTASEIRRILIEFGRVLKPDGQIVLFWPMAIAPSVCVLKGVHFVLHKVARSSKQLHPPEISLLQSEAHAAKILEEAGLRLVSFDFGIRDLFTQAVIVAKKVPSVSA